MQKAMFICMVKISITSNVDSFDIVLKWVYFSFDAAVSPYVLCFYLLTHGCSDYNHETTHAEVILLKVVLKV